MSEFADAELASWVQRMRAEQKRGEPAAPLDVSELRRAGRERALARRRLPEVFGVEDREADGVPVRLYQPGPQRPPSTVVFLHGGAWTVGDLESHDGACRRIATGTGAAVLAVDYRRAPEHPWPAAVDDAVTALRWTAARYRRPLAVMGDSSGGNLAALASLRLRDEGGPVPDLQVLAYPNTDLTLSQPSVKEKATGWGLDADFVAWGAANWVPDPARRGDPAVSPLFAPDLTGLPSAVVVTAEHDPLRDEGDAYARRLADAGVTVRHRCEPGMVHGFLTLDTVSPAAAAAAARLIADVAAMLPESQRERL